MTVYAHSKEIFMEHSEFNRLWPSFSLSNELDPKGLSHDAFGAMIQWLDAHLPAQPAAEPSMALS